MSKNSSESAVRVCSTAIYVAKLEANSKDSPFTHKKSSNNTLKSDGDRAEARRSAGSSVSFAKACNNSAHARAHFVFASFFSVSSVSPKTNIFGGHIHTLT